MIVELEMTDVDFVNGGKKDGGDAGKSAGGGSQIPDSWAEAIAGFVIGMIEVWTDGK